jgi:hypothetical protein
MTSDACLEMHKLTCDPGLKGCQSIYPDFGIHLTTNVAENDGRDTRDFARTVVGRVGRRTSLIRAVLGKAFGDQFHTFQMAVSAANKSNGCDQESDARTAPKVTIFL